MRAIKLPEPPSGFMSTPEIFEAGVYSIVRRAIIIGNGLPGSENQCFGLVRALGLSDNQTLYRVIRPSGGVNEWLKWLPVSLHKKLEFLMRRIWGSSPVFASFRTKRLLPYFAENGGNVGLTSLLGPDAKQIADMARETFDKEGPLLVVASGRDTISLASSIKRLGSQNVFLVQIQHPRVKVNRFDLIVTPHHDYYPLTPAGQAQIPRLLRRFITPREPPDRHVVLTVGALHQADSTALRVAASAFHEDLAPLPKPLLILNIGGPTCHCKYGADLAQQLAKNLHKVLATCGSVRISFSRRTPKKVADVIVNEFGAHPKVYIWDGQEPNPYMGHLAWGDAFLITADSISMLSEACSTGKPVYVIGAERCTWKFAAFHKTLRDRGVVRTFTGNEDISVSWSYPPLNDITEAANRVREALAEKGWTLRR